MDRLKKNGITAACQSANVQELNGRHKVSNILEKNFAPPLLP